MKWLNLKLYVISHSQPLENIIDEQFIKLNHAGDV